MKEISAGGVIASGNNVLVLHKFRGDWVLPKGRVEEGESLEDTALREVWEESGYQCQIHRKLGFVKYNYDLPDGTEVQKTVHYFAMTVIGGEARPQKEEGFRDSVFIPWKKAVKLLRHDSERNMVRTAFHGDPPRRGSHRFFKRNQ